ncbi:MAG: hypothetical protein SPK50_00975 [Mobiluncus porci]|uniref:Uncharacterized protein n=1 Tax=Mobiluncus porci TaxID=2652278 RepID=A0A7K0K2B1_9ACTO|nr:hypothetical protein [Mobiluncus porci]MDD7542385.1 hypothetical protein [Mobiluncus porci]MDY5747694.1 hypothetical protein [Mobiluncus porci]MST49626.1 hypothetical protein [Mobiluncus porci]
MKTRLTSIIAGVVAASLSIFAITPAAVAEPNVSSDSTSTIQGYEVTESEMEQFSKDIETIFTRYVIYDGTEFKVNGWSVLIDGYYKNIQQFRNLAQVLNDPNLAYTITDTEKRDAVAFGQCLLFSALGISATALTAAAWAEIGTAVAAWNWGLAATTVL